MYLVASTAIYRHTPFDGIDRNSSCCPSASRSFMKGHLSSSVDAAGKSYACRVGTCSRRFSSAGWLWRHFKKLHELPTKEIWCVLPQSLGPTFKISALVLLPPRHIRKGILHSLSRQSVMRHLWLKAGIVALSEEHATT
jgi:uncharacterized Zn-finger protein